MARKPTDDVLAQLDLALEEIAPVFCWVCEARKGEPSMCPECRSAMGEYTAPPKDKKRIPWIAPESV